MSDIQLSLNDVLIMLLAIAGVVALIFLIICLRKLSKVIDKADSICDDAKLVTGIAAKRVAEVDDAVDSVANYIADSIMKIKEALGFTKKLGGASNALSNIGKIFKKNK